MRRLSTPQTQPSLIILHNRIESNSSFPRRLEDVHTGRMKASAGGQKKLFIPIIGLFDDSVNAPSMGGGEVDGVGVADKSSN